MSEKITDAHKATIKKHLEESPGVPLDQVHRELGEIFQYKGKYSSPQITAVTSWLRSANLQNRRTNDFDAEEDFGDTSEDIDYNTPAKINSREWHFANIVKATTEEQRREMKLLLMPGRNTFDFEAAEKAGLQGSNLITYMRGDVPAANAEYIRNARRFGVVHRRIGDMEKKLQEEDQVTQAAYLDFFGQFCPSYLRTIYQLPIDPNYDPISISINVMEGREHAKTSRRLNQVNHLITNYGNVVDAKDDSGYDKAVDLFTEALEIPVKMSQIRARALMMQLFVGVGAANTKNWLIPDQIKQFTMCNNDNENYDDLDQMGKFKAFTSKLQEAVNIFAGSKEQFKQNGIDLDLVLIGMATRLAIVNTAQIKDVEPPEHYVSPNGNRPFISFAARLQTHRDYYSQFVEAMDFYLRITGDSYERLKKSNEMGYFDSIGYGSNKIFRFFAPNGQLITSIKLDKLSEAQSGLVKHRSTTELVGYSKEEWEEVEKKKIEQAKKILPPAAPINHLLDTSIAKIPQLSLKRNIDPSRIGRNDPCYCGSGKKFKKCCGSY